MRRLMQVSYGHQDHQTVTSEQEYRKPGNLGIDHSPDSLRQRTYKLTAGRNVALRKTNNMPAKSTAGYPLVSATDLL